MIVEVLSFVFVLGLLIFVHELGHFSVAKWCGIRVEQFSLGFPPKMFGIRRGDTEYRISWIPLGGYVKMAGEKPEESEIKGEPYEFMSKPIWQRALVIVAGPVMNYVLTFFLLAGIYLFQGKAVVDESRAVVGSVLNDSPAEKVGLQPKDVVLAVNDSTVHSFQEMYNIISKRPGEELKLTLGRGSDTLNTFVTTSSDTVLNMKGDVEVVGKIGVSVDHTYEPMALAAAVSSGFAMTNYFGGMILKFLSDLITGSVSSRLIGGPLFIAQAAGQAAKEGLASLLFLAAILSVNLAVVNLVPIPVLDGGQLLFLAMEKIRGKPVSLRTRAIMQQVGLVFLILLIIFVTKNDIWRINLFGW